MQEPWDDGNYQSESLWRGSRAAGQSENKSGLFSPLGRIDPGGPQLRFPQPPSVPSQKLLSPASGFLPALDLTRAHAENPSHADELNWEMAFCEPRGSSHALRPGPDALSHARQLEAAEERLLFRGEGRSLADNVLDQ